MRLIKLLFSMRRSEKNCLHYFCSIGLINEERTRKCCIYEPLKHINTLLINMEFDIGLDIIAF